MTKPTTAECIEWLWHDKEDPWSPKSKTIAESIRAKLLAAEEMAKALETKYAWLIERSSLLWGTEWFCAGENRWTKDAYKAIQFPDKNAAEEIAKLVRPDIASYPFTDKGEDWNYQLSVTEHGFDSLALAAYRAAGEQ